MMIQRTASPINRQDVYKRALENLNKAKANAGNHSVSGNIVRMVEVPKDDPSVTRILKAIR
ncbi:MULTISPECIES: hypothetical protein [Paenibacillus]|nr:MULTISPECIES: hypothetical protein [Paenibacillus]